MRRVPRGRLALLAVPFLFLVACGDDDTVAPGSGGTDVVADVPLGDLGLDDAPGGTDAVADVADAEPLCTPASCDDGNPCTDDTCDPAVGCSNPANTASCDDGDACTDKDVCQGGTCTAGPALDCDDKNVCTTDACDKATGCTHAFAQGPCDDGDGCTTGEVCVPLEEGNPNGGKCGTGAALTCDDANPCTDDACDLASGCTHTDNTSPCTDGNACTTGDACAVGLCAAGTATACDDQNPCTDDSCDAGNGNCVFLPNAATCSDGDACTSNDACQAGLCAGQPGACGCATDADCDDKNACTTDTCADNACAFALAAGATCTDGDECTEGDLCVPLAAGNGNGGKCASGAAKACDDGNPCTDDGCVPGVGCASTFNSAPCDDGNAATGGDVCKAGVCAGVLTGACAADAECDDKDACTDDACVAGKCNSKPAGNGKACDDGNGCTEADACTNGKCVPGKAKACDDGNACTDDACDPKTGACLTKNNAAPCSDGSACTVADACKDGKCQGGAALFCDDKNVCTADACDAASGCTHAAQAGGCDDGNACTTADACADSACVGGAAPDCDDANPCTDDACDLATGCTHTDNNVACDDGSACSTQDTCQGGSCLGGPPLDCDDKNLCTDDACELATGCTHTDNSDPCDDGDACTTQDTCAAAGCVGGPALGCDDGNPCSVDSCDKLEGCQHVNAQNGTVCTDASCDGLVHTADHTCFSGICLPGPKSNCDDGNGCTDNTCDAKTGCAKANNTAACDDGTVCTKDDACKNGACIPGPTVVCDDGNNCTVDSCDPVKGCQVANASDGAVCVDPTCKDGVHDKGALCKAGQCEAIGGPKSCDDKNPCTNDLCSPTGGCSYQNNTAPCDDGNACTSEDACLAAVCSGGKAVTCNDDNPCTDDKCDTTAGCVFTNSTKPCDDGSVCTKDDACAGGQCVPGAAIDCDDKNPCTNNACDKVLGCQAVNNTASCDDGNACNLNDVCKDGKCAGSGGKDCSDGNPCTIDTCDAQGGCQNPPVQDGTACSSAACVSGGYQAPATCSAGQCGAKPAPESCNDQNPCTTDICNAAQGCLHPNNTSPCDDGNACTKSDACGGGACTGDKVVCADDNVCTDDGCDPKTGCTATPNTAACDDANLCTTKDLCKDGACAGTTPPNCDDSNPCTDDSCDPKKGCVNAANTKPCDDGNACTTNDVCGAAKCVGGAAAVCDDKNPCTTDACDPGKGCVASNNTAPCDDGDACTTKDTCAGGACVGGVAPVCDDKNPCTTDSCDKAKGCVTSNLADGTVCLQSSCNALIFQAQGKCQTGTCAVPKTQDCDDANDCTADTCNASTGCSSATKPWGATCKPADTTLLDPFCAGTLCTGFEAKIVQPGGAAATRGALHGVDRTGNAGVFAAGWDNVVNPSQGVVTGIVESPLGGAFKGADGSSKSIMAGVRNRLAVGGPESKAPVMMAFNAVSGVWSTVGAPKWAVTRPLNGVDLYKPSATVETYVLGGDPDAGQTVWATVGRVDFAANQFGAVTRMLVTKDETLSGCAEQVAMRVHDVYAAAGNAIFLAGFVQKGNAFQSLVAFHGGNTHTSCGKISGYKGEFYVDDANETADLQLTVNTGAVPAIGFFTTIAGTSASHVLVGGTHGTLFHYDGATWKQLTPAYAGMPVAWSSAFDVNGVHLAGNEAWVTGELITTPGGNPCRTLFALHGQYDAVAKTWTWNKLFVSGTLLSSCGATANYSQANDVWVDPATSSVYFVGSQGTDNTGKPVVLNATQQRQLVVRVKTK